LNDLVDYGIIQLTYLWISKAPQKND